MSSPLALLPLLGPLALLAVALVARREPGLRPRRVLLASRAATLATLAVAVLGGAMLAAHGSLTSPLLGLLGVGVSVRWDPLSAVMFGLVAFVGAVVVQYSRNYLDGDARQGAFMGDLCLTLAAVLLLVTAGNLFQLFLAWVGTSLALHRLLLFYPERPQAVLAARKKFIVARVGDACLFLACLLMAAAFGSLDIAAIHTAAASALSQGEIPAAAELATGFLVVAALLKSAQFPTHGWLTEVMETPTPVSALLHAGIVNAGGFLIVRFADVMVLSAPSLHLLALVGGFTALFGSVVMLTQTSVKVSLAWSTVAQMGFMLLQCGLGAFSSAVLHIVAHSLYKAHAFLSSGSVVELARASWVPSAATRPRLATILAAMGTALLTFVLTGALLGVGIEDKPAIVALGAILVLGLSHLLAQALMARTNDYVLGRTMVAVTLVSLAYFLLQGAAAQLLAPVLPASPALDGLGIAVTVLAVGSFAAITILQLLQPAHAGSWWWRAAYVLIANGFYANAVFNRLVGALRLPAADRARS